MEDGKLKKSLFILGGGILSLIMLALGYNYGMIFLVITISVGAITYIFYVDEKKNGNANALTFAGSFIAIACGAIAIIMIISRF